MDLGADILQGDQQRLNRVDAEPFSSPEPSGQPIS
jgi:hypothetical protein